MFRVQRLLSTHFHRIILSSWKGCLTSLPAMSRQATLFGKTVKKQPFFKNNPSPSSPYYQTINSMWQVSKSFDKESFFSDAQKLWKEKYSSNEAAREELYAEAERVQSGHKSLVSSFLAPRSECARSSESVSACPSPAISSSAAPSTSKPVELFCQDVGVNSGKFLTSEVTGQVTLMGELSTFAERWLVFRKERRFYESSSLYSWSTSWLAGMLSEAGQFTTKVKLLMDQVCSVQIDQRSILTSSGSQAVQRKMGLLTVLSADLARYKSNLEVVIDRLQIRKSQIHARGRGKEFCHSSGLLELPGVHIGGGYGRSHGATYRSTMARLALLCLLPSSCIALVCCLPAI